jgi:hypothetical protein
MNPHDIERILFLHRFCGWLIVVLLLVAAILAIIIFTK